MHIINLVQYKKNNEMETDYSGLVKIHNPSANTDDVILDIDRRAYIEVTDISGITIIKNTSVGNGTPVIPQYAVVPSFSSMGPRLIADASDATEQFDRLVQQLAAASYMNGSQGHYALVELSRKSASRYYVMVYGADVEQVLNFVQELSSKVFSF